MLMLVSSLEMQGKSTDGRNRCKKRHSLTQKIPLRGIPVRRLSDQDLPFTRFLWTAQLQQLQTFIFCPRAYT